MGSDSHGIYVPLIRDVVMTTHDDAWWKNGELCILKDDPCFNQVVIDIQLAATCADASAVMSGDSIVRLTFIFGGNVIEGQPNDLLSGMQKQLYTKVKTLVQKIELHEHMPHSACKNTKKSPYVKSFNNHSVLFIE